MMNRWSAWRVAAVGAVLAVGSSLPAYAVNKDMVQLQTQIQQLQDAVARLQQSNDERMGVLKDLVQQTADAVNKMTLTVGGLQQQMDKDREAAAAKSDTAAGQIQSLNDSLDELRARLARMEKTLGDVQGQLGQTNAMLGNLPQGGGGGAVAPAAATAPVAPAGGGEASAQPGAAIPMPDNAAPAAAAPISRAGAAAAVGAPPVVDLYRAAYSDYNAGKQALATSEFGDVIKAYPDDNYSGNAYFYLGEMSLRANKPAAAIKDYDRVLEQYPNNAKIPAAHLHKAEALSDEGQKDAAARELRALIQRFPTSPEASLAKAKLARAR